MEPSSEANAELRDHVRQQEVVAELGRQALDADDLDLLLHDASAAVADALDADYCGVFQFSPDGTGVVLRDGVGWRDGLVGTATVPTERDSPIGSVLEREGSVVVTDLRADDRFSGSELLASHDVGSAISVPVGPSDDPWGVLGTYATTPREFTDRDAYFGRSVANVLASAIQNDRTQSELEEIYGRISDAFFALDDQWRFTYLNERAHEIINPEGKTLVGKNVWEESPDAVGRKFEEQYEQAMREQETVSFEEYYPEPLDAWFEVRAYPSETGISVCFRNVTERKQVQQRLEEERDIFAQGPAIVFRWKNEPGWPVEYVSENVEDVLGYAPTELESGDVPYTDLHLDEEIDRIAREVEQNSDETTDRFSHEP
jgi:PAS domain S-box-containing protein